MPEAEIRRRGGARRVRTKKLPDGRYVHIFVVDEEGPRGGHTVAGPVRKRKGYAPPKYRPKPEPVLPPRTRRNRRGSK